MTNKLLTLSLLGFTLLAAKAEEQKFSATPILNPFGLHLNEWRFQWDANEQQTAYQILVADHSKKLEFDIGDLWDSGWQRSNQNKFHYEGKPLPDDTTIFWKVKFKTSHGDFAGLVQSFTTQKVKVAQTRKRTATTQGGNPRYSDGKFGQALLLGHQPLSIQIPNYPALNPQKETTISAWIKPSATPDQWQTIFRKEDGSDRRLLALGKTHNIWGLWIGLGIDGVYHEFGKPIPKEQLGDGNWHHVAGTFDGKMLRLFCDGKEIGHQAMPGQLGQGSSSPTMIGSYAQNREPFRGGIDDVRVYNQALAPQQMSTTNSIVGWWKFDGSLENEITKTVEPKINRIVFLGNTLISRMEEFGYLETALTAQWPYHDITFRNLGWPADDVSGTARSEFGSAHNTRSWRPPGSEAGFGYTTLMEQITEAQPKVLFVGYGSEVAFTSGDKTFAEFQTGYNHLLSALEQSGAQLILLSPPRQEKTEIPLPDLTSRNQRLQSASTWIQAVAAERGHRFIDLYNQLVPADSNQHLTENGLHLNQAGYKKMSRVILEQLELNSAPIRLTFNEKDRPNQPLEDHVATTRGHRFDLTPDSLTQKMVLTAPGNNSLKINGIEQPIANAATWSKGITIQSGPSHDQLEALRALIVEKNQLHRYRIRPMNKAYIFLFRRHEMGHLAYELKDFDRLIEEKEELIARLRKPRTHRYEIEQIVDWKTPRKYPDHEVPQKIPTPDIASELKAFTIAEGFKINLFAANPMIANPINLNWDTRGRAWVSTSSTYPHIKPGKNPNDRIVILEDVDHDGQADTSTVFAEGLLVPHSVMPVRGGAYVCSSTEVLFLADHDGDDRADERRVVFSGFGNADVHHMIHGFRWAPWGELYFTQSIYINSFVETLWGNRRLNGSGIWQFRPETEQLDVLSRGMINPWGHAFDRWGQSFATDGAGGAGPHFVFPGAAFPSAVGAPRILSGLIPGKPKNTAAEFLSGRHIPERWQGSLLANDFRANRTIRYELKEKGSGYTAAEVETVLRSSHRSFRPVDLKMGPDGAVYVVDWYNPIIDHGEVDFHHPSRDKKHGRIWRLTAKNKPLIKPPEIHGTPIPELLKLLQAPEAWTRLQVKRELTNRDHEAVIRALAPSIQTLDEPGQLEALWLHGALQKPNPELLTQVLRAKDHRIRAAGVRMISVWLEQLPAPLTLLAKAIVDEHPRVRLEAVNALRQAGSLNSVTLALEALDFSTDKNLDYALWLTLRETQDQWLSALQSGQPVFNGQAKRIEYALKASSSPLATAQLLNLLTTGGLKNNEMKNIGQTIAGLGKATELDTLLRLAVKKTFLLPSLAEGARQNASRPTKLDPLLTLLENESTEVQLAAANLTGHWRYAAAQPKLLAQLTHPDGLPEIRNAAADGLVQLGAFNLLKNLSTGDQPPEVRTTAIAAWAKTKPEQAIGPAITWLSETQKTDQVSPIFSAFVNNKNGSTVLTKGIAEKKLSAAVAREGIRIIESSGRNLPELINILATAGALPPPTSSMTQQEKTALLTEVEKQGHRELGQKIFQRKSLACLHCHVVGDNGGLLGPNLTTVGSYMTPESILESLLNPSSSIKQGYETVTITRKDKTIVSGILHRRTDTTALVRDPAGQIVSIPNDQIAEIDTSPVSLMPPGLTTSLQKNELIDLIKYLTNLGKNNPDRRTLK